MDEEQAQIIRQIAGLSEISDRYDVILCDIWGVLHNGLASFAEASDALVSFRGRCGVVVLISNAPRPSPPIKQQVLKLGVSPDAFDAVVTSGDVTVGLMEEHPGDKVLHIGPERDLTLFEAAIEADGARLTLVSLEDAQYALCTGLRRDETETVEDYEAELRAMLGRGMTMICANPDVVIHRGETVIYCAGALARRYEDLGGSVIYAGKPYGPIYDRALALAGRVRRAPVEKRRVLAIGDGMKTDIIGARQAGLDALFVTGGIHRSLHKKGLTSPADPDALRQLCEENGVSPVAAIPMLRP